MYDDRFPGAELQLPSPFDIDATNPLYGAFGHSETEASALWVLRLCQKQGGWYPVSPGALEDLYQATHAGHHYSFNRLVTGGWLESEPGDTGRFRVTLDFVARCWRASPAANRGEAFDAPTEEARGVPCRSGVD